MSQFFIVTGKLGSGKSLVTVGKIRDYLEGGRAIATNLNLNVERLVNPFAKKTRITRLPDKPTADDLMSLAPPYEGDYDESKTGLLVLDECGTWFNTRGFQDKDRTNMIDCLLHIRKRGWDVMLIIQHLNMLDKQARDGLAEQLVLCRRLDRLPIPFLTSFAKLAGFDIRPPKIHFGMVKYGSDLHAPIVARWVYRGTDLYDAYDTRQIFVDSRSPNRDGGYWGPASMLPPFTVHGRYTTKWQEAKRNVIKTIESINRAVSARGAFSVGAAVGFLALKLLSSPVPDAIAAQPGDTSANDALSHVVEEQAHPLSEIWITASVRHNSGFEYVFYRGESEDSVTIVRPEQLGYSVRWIAPCKAALVSPEETHYITCFPYHAPEPGASRA